MPLGASPATAEAWTWENAAAGAAAGFATVAALHPLDVVRTRFQVSGGRGWSEMPPYRNTAHAVYTISRFEGLRGLYAGFSPAVLGSTVSWGYISFFITELSKVVTLLVCVKPDALRTILKEEGFLALYRGIGPGLLLNSIDFAALGAGSKVAAILLTYPYQVIRARLQQRPGSDGTPKYSNSWHVVKETAKYEGVRGFYRGITSNLLKNLPAASLTFVVYENVIKLFKSAKEKT
ncbi:hypothetical protein HU200_047798 [Digitaria exilis]|uniref:Folate transporter 1, chloroplastic n=1 Tax=Digitaria exilis TaxID=1010633 RepID=A0A835AWG9_9POAL|nr:hypothetical protein HU200_047798 [Digitaria exilis]